MRTSLFLIVLIYTLLKEIITEFTYISELENRSNSSKDNKHLEEKISNIFSYYNNIIHDKNINVKETTLIQNLKNEVGKILPQKNNPPSNFSFLQQNEESTENNDKLFSYQPFVMTKLYTKFNPPSSRRGHTTLIADTFLLVFGGCFQEIKCYNDIFFLDLRSRKWIEIPTLGQKPGARGGHAASLYGTTLYVFAGNTEEGYLNDIFSINLETREWKQEYFLGDTPSPRTNINGVSDEQGRMIVFGGYTENGYDNTIYILNFINKIFEKPSVQGNIPSKRENYGMVYLNNRVWVFGGFQEGGVLNDLYSIDTITWTWTIVETSGPKPPASQGMSMTRVGKKIYITGGCDVRKRKCFSETYVLDTDSLWWTKIENNKSQMQPRESFTSVFFRGHLYSFGGCQLHMFCYNDVFIMNVNDNCPAKCSGHGVCKNKLGCACNIGFSEHDCSIKTKCRKDCSGNGYCHNNAKCGCFPGYTGPFCEVNLNCPKNCTSFDNGYCSSSGTCVCKPGYTGEACEQISSGDVIYTPKVEKRKNITIVNVKNKKKSNLTKKKKIHKKVNKTKSIKHNKSKIVSENADLKRRLKSFEEKIEKISNITFMSNGNTSSNIKKNRTKNNKIDQYIKENKKKSDKFINNLATNYKIPIFLQTKKQSKIVDK